MIIGREDELSTISDLLKSGNSELLAITGRRRVGKTYLITESLKNQIIFEFVGTKNADMQSQLKKFDIELKKHFSNILNFKDLSDWIDAFEQLSICLSSVSHTRRKKHVVFLDEFPWIASKKSNFLAEFEYWWNTFGSRNNIMVVISGSATSWIMENIINNKGGLYNRISHHIILQPFTLYETRKYLLSKKIRLDPYDVVQLYMTLGGIPHYLKAVKKGLSVQQNIKNMCFQKGGILTREFENLYAALFDQPQNYINIAKVLASKWKGLTRQEIARLTKIADGGTLTKSLESLEECSFIIKVHPFGSKTREVLYRIVDEFTIFYFAFMAKTGNTINEAWGKSAKYSSWQGYAFENICFRHQKGIAQALGISGIEKYFCSFLHRGSSNSRGFQIDMLIDRSDNCINLCEMKFFNTRVIVDKKMASGLMNRRQDFLQLTATKKTVFTTIVTSYGIKSNDLSLNVVDSVVTLDQIMKQKNL